jgi:hypothetical protein
MPEKLGLATGLSKGLAFFEDVYMTRLRKKLEDQMAEKTGSRKHFMDQADAKDEADRKKADAADVNKQTERANQDAIGRQKAAFDADVDSDTTLDPEVKSRAKSLAALGTSEGLARAESLVTQHRKTAATPVKVDNAADYKDKIAKLGGWSEARKQNPRLVAEAEVYGVKPEKDPSTRTAAGDKPPGAQQLIKDALAHVSGQEKSAAAIAAKIMADPDNTSTAEEAKATVQQIMGLDPDKRKAAITYLKTEGKMRNPQVSDSLVADWSQPGDFVDTTKIVDPKKIVDPNAAPKYDAATAIDPNAEPGRVFSPTGKPMGASTGVVAAKAAPTGMPAGGVAPAAAGVSPEQEAKLKEQQARVDRILRELEDELGAR